MEDFYAHIDEYMNGSLTGEELSLFEAEMENNLSLKKAVENYDAAKGISEGLLEIDMLETLNRLKVADKNRSVDQSSSSSEASVHQLPKSDSEIKPKKQKFNITRWLVAASMLGIIAFTGWWVMEMNATAKYKKYVLANYEQPIDEDATKSIDTEGLTNFEKGKYLFALNRFEESIPWFEEYLSQGIDQELQSVGYEWLGAAYLHVRREDDAIKALRKSQEEKAKRNLEMLLKRDK